MWTHQTTAHFSTLCQSISDELSPEEPAEFLGVVDIWLWLRVLTCTLTTSSLKLLLHDQQLNCSALAVPFWFYGERGAALLGEGATLGVTYAPNCRRALGSDQII